MISIDFETYSESGYDFRDGKWCALPNARITGLSSVGAPAYSEHETTEVLSLAYDCELWLPGMPSPQQLINHVYRGGKIAAWNAAFEFYIWNNICVPTYGWPRLKVNQLSDTMARSAAFGLPQSLDKAGAALELDIVKDKEGKRLLTLYSKPRKPTKKDPRLRLPPEQALYDYNLKDVQAEIAIANVIPELSEFEKEVQRCHHAINTRGVYIDQKRLQVCIDVVQYVTKKYTDELLEITDNQITSINQIKKIIEWCGWNGSAICSLSHTSVLEHLALPEIPDNVRRVLELRQILSSSSVKKLYSIQRRLSSDGRLRDLFAFCGAERTGRFTGKGPQPQNLPASGASVQRENSDHGRLQYSKSGPHVAWTSSIVDEIFERLYKRDYENIIEQFHDPISLVSSCLRSLFSAADGHELVCSDYSAIEAVVLACLAREEWRIDVFKTHGLIYEMSASKITGVPFQDFIEHKKATGEHHPLRKKIGKVSELASGYQGSVGAWKAFGADKHLSDAEILNAVKQWRKASPNIVNFWYRVEDCARFAITHHGHEASHNGTNFVVTDDVLYITLLSGRKLAYHKPRLDEEGKISYLGRRNSAWVRLETYGGKLTENIVQATARDVLAHAITLLEKSGHPIVLHVHDEIVCEVKIGTLSIERLETLMTTLPGWCADWPLRAAGGWIGSHYRKD